MLVAQNSLGPVCPVPLTVRGTFEALGVACKRTAVRLTRATATKEGLADAEDCLDALQASSGAKLGPEYFDVVPLLEVRALQYHGWPNQSCRIMSKPKSHIGAGAAGIAAAASSTSFRRRLQADAPMRPRAGARGRPGVVRAPPRARGRAPAARCNS